MRDLHLVNSQRRPNVRVRVAGLRLLVHGAEEPDTGIPPEHPHGRIGMDGRIELQMHLAQRQPAQRGRVEVLAQRLRAHQLLVGVNPEEPVPAGRVEHAVARLTEALGQFADRGQAEHPRARLQGQRRGIVHAAAVGDDDLVGNALHRLQALRQVERRVVRDEAHRQGRHRPRGQDAVRDVPLAERFGCARVRHEPVAARVAAGRHGADRHVRDAGVGLRPEDVLQVVVGVVVHMPALVRDAVGQEFGERAGRHRPDPPRRAGCRQAADARQFRDVRDVLGELPAEHAIERVLSDTPAAKRVGAALLVEVPDGQALERHAVGDACLLGGRACGGDVLLGVVEAHDLHIGRIEREPDGERAVAAGHVQHARAVGQAGGAFGQALVAAHVAHDVLCSEVPVVHIRHVLPGDDAPAERRRLGLAECVGHMERRDVVVMLQQLAQDAGRARLVALAERGVKERGPVGRDRVVGVRLDVLTALRDKLVCGLSKCAVHIPRHAFDRPFLVLRR